MTTVTCHNKAPGYNCDYNASVDHNSTVATTDPIVTTDGFPAATAIAACEDEHLITKRHTLLRATINDEPSVLHQGEHVTYTSFGAISTEV